MNRANFLRALAATPFLATLSAATPEPKLTKIAPIKAYDSTPRGSLDKYGRPSAYGIVADIVFHQSGYRPRQAGVEKLAQTGDVEKYSVWAQRPDGVRIWKEVTISGVLLAVSGPGTWYDRSELGYSLAKAAHELGRHMSAHIHGRDMSAHIHGIDRWRAPEHQTAQP